MNQAISSKSPEAIGCELVQQAHNRDGIPEIMMGAFFLVATGLIYLQPYLPTGPENRRAIAIAIAIGLPALMILAKTVLLPRLRERYFIESFGYVKYGQWSRRRILPALAILAVFALLNFGVAPQLGNPDRWRHVLPALLIAVTFMWFGKPRRMFWYGVITAAAAVLVVLADMPTPNNFKVLFGTIGITSFVGGSITFVRFVREHRAAK